jgi:hypothetical protein
MSVRHGRSRPVIRLLLVGAAVGTAAAAVGCSAGDKVLDQVYVETTVAHKLAEQVNQPVPDVTCPDDLKAEVGATMECTLVPQGETTMYPVHVKVTSVDTDKHTANFDVEVGEAEK